MFSRLEIGEFILAPRPRYSIEEVSYTPVLNDAASAGCLGCGIGAIKEWDIVLRVHCIGNGDLTAARRAYTQLEAYLNDVCNSNVKTFVRQYCDEQPLEHFITRAYIQPINLDWMPDCCDNTSQSGEVHLTASLLLSGATIMQYDLSVLKAKSLI